MFSKNKKTKLSPQVRFQHRQFTRKLETARNFKRQARSIPENPIDLFLSQIGLGNRWTEILIGLMVLGFLYLIYFPNFLSVRAIRVNGLADSDRIIAEASANQAISSAPFFNPQHNLLFLNTKSVETGIMKVPSVYRVVSVKKDFKQQTVNVVVAPKVERYLVTDGEKVFDVYNDGTLKGQAGINKDDWVTTHNQSMVKVQLPAVLKTTDLAPFFNPNLVESIEKLAGSLRDLPGSPLEYVKAGMVSVKQILNDDGSTSTETGDLALPIASTEISAVLHKGTSPQTYTVIFDSQTDVTEAVKRLSLLLSQTDPNRYKNLNYIDMRLPSKSYVCLINTPCAK